LISIYNITNYIEFNIVKSNKITTFYEDLRCVMKNVMNHAVAMEIKDKIFGMLGKKQVGVCGKKNVIPLASKTTHIPPFHRTRWHTSGGSFSTTSWEPGQKNIGPLVDGVSVPGVRG
jgi:hypothetical protein